MTALLLHSCANGLCSSRRMARPSVERADFMMIATVGPPDLLMISKFRRRHLRALSELFVRVLRLVETAGLVKPGHVALDGNKVMANASTHKAMSYAHIRKREMELRAEVDRWLGGGGGCRPGGARKRRPIPVRSSMFLATGQKRSIRKRFKEVNSMMEELSG